MSKETIQQKLFIIIWFEIDLQIQNLWTKLPNKLSYNLFYVIDLFNFVLFYFNRSNILTTIIIILLEHLLFWWKWVKFIDIIMKMKKRWFYWTQFNMKYFKK